MIEEKEVCYVNHEIISIDGVYYMVMTNEEVLAEIDKLSFCSGGKDE